METKRLVLRPWLESDAEELYSFACDPELAISAGWLPHSSKTHSLKVLKEVLINPDQYAIVDKCSDRLVGSIGLSTAENSGITDLAPDDFVIGFWVGRELWNQGYATEAGKPFLRMLFKDRGASRVWTSSFEGNARSERVQEKLGLKYKYSEFIVHPILRDAFMINVRCVTRDEFLKEDK